MVVNARLINLSAVRMNNDRTGGRYDREKFPTVVIGLCDFAFKPKKNACEHVARTHWTVCYEGMWDAVEMRENGYFLRCLSKCLRVPVAHLRSVMIGDTVDVKFFNWRGRIDVTPRRYLVNSGQTRHMIRKFVWKDEVPENG